MYRKIWYRPNCCIKRETRCAEMGYSCDFGTQVIPRQICLSQYLPLTSEMMKQTLQTNYQRRRLLEIYLRRKLVHHSSHLRKYTTNKQITWAPVGTVRCNSWCLCVTLPKVMFTHNVFPQKMKPLIKFFDIGICDTRVVTKNWVIIKFYVRFFFYYIKQPHKRP